MSPSHWNIANSILMINLLVDKEVFTDHNYSTWTNTTWHLNEHMCGLVYWEDVLSNDMIETKVHFVQGEGFLEVTRVDRTEILI